MALGENLFFYKCLKSGFKVIKTYDTILTFLFYGVLLNFVDLRGPNRPKIPSEVDVFHRIKTTDVTSKRCA